MKRLLSILSALALLAGMSVAAPLSVSATGTCSTATVEFFENENLTGASRIFCYGVNDSNIEGEQGLVMGPLNNGTYKDDFDTSETQSSALSALYNDNGSSVRVCFYTGKNYSGNSSYLTATGAKVFAPSVTPGSFKFTTSSC